MVYNAFPDFISLSSPRVHATVYAMSSELPSSNLPASGHYNVQKYYPRPVPGELQAEGKEVFAEGDVILAEGPDPRKREVVMIRPPIREVPVSILWDLGKAEHVT